MSERGYRWDSEDYARHSSAQLEWALELIGKLGLGAEETVLDIGSGDGKVTALLAARVPRGEVLGIDSSPDMVERARQAYPPERHPNLRFQLGDAREIDFAERFDAVFSNATLHWVRDHRPVLRGAARALKPGGRLLFQMGGRGNARAILAVLEEAGLIARRVELLPKRMRQQGAEGLAGWVRTTWLPYTQAVPAEHREELVVKVVERYLRSHPPAADGMVGVDMVRLEVEALRP